MNAMPPDNAFESGRAVGSAWLAPSGAPINANVLRSQLRVLDFINQLSYLSRSI